jgi:cholesterol transport system auxiliary component
VTRLSLPLVLALALAGCGATPTSYDLSAATPGRFSRGTLVVEAARVEPPYDGAAIVIRTAGALERLGGAQWADSLPRLAQSRVTETLENAGWRVGDAGAARLRLDIRRFEVDSVLREARVDVAAQFYAGRAVAMRMFAASEPVGEISGAAPAQALDRAFSRVLGDLARWTVSQR